LYVATAFGFAARHRRVSSLQNDRHQLCRPLSIAAFGVN
jgi:hypothetical protein